jgi:hypothetical protein
MKYSPMENVKLYFGVKASTLWMLIVGIKVAGVKILMPWTNLLYKIFPRVEEEYEE